MSAAAAAEAPPVNGDIQQQHGQGQGCENDATASSSAVAMETEKLDVSMDDLTFEAKRAQDAQVMETFYAERLKKKQKRWEKEVARMRAEFLRLRPDNDCDVSGGQSQATSSAAATSTSVATAAGDPYILERKGSTDVLDPALMKTLIKEYKGEGRRFRLRFDVNDFDKKSLQVVVEKDRIVVKATKVGSSQDGDSTSGSSYSRKIAKPREVDAKKVKSSLSADGILTVECPLPPSSLDLRRRHRQPETSPSRSVSQDSNYNNRSPLPSPTSPIPPPVAMTTVPPSMTSSQVSTVSSSAVSVGTLLEPPSFEERNGVRHMSLIIPLGPHYKAKDIIVQAIKDNRILIEARHEDRVPDKMLKARFSKEFDLPERIATLSLRGGLLEDGRLFVSALARVSTLGLSRDQLSELASQEVTARQATPCSVVDLSTFPPVACQACR